MKHLEIRLKNGDVISISFADDTLLTRKGVRPDGKRNQIFMQNEEKYMVHIPEEHIASVEKRDGLIIGLPNKLN